MSETEMEDYFLDRKFNVLNLYNFIDYDDIENPVQTIQL